MSFIYVNLYTVIGYKHIVLFVTKIRSLFSFHSRVNSICTILDSATQPRNLLVILCQCPVCPLWATRRPNPGTPATPRRVQVIPNLTQGIHNRQLTLATMQLILATLNQARATHNLVKAIPINHTPLIRVTQLKAIRLKVTHLLNRGTPLVDTPAKAMLSKTSSKANTLKVRLTACLLVLYQAHQRYVETCYLKNTLLWELGKYFLKLLLFFNILAMQHLVCSLFIVTNTILSLPWTHLPHYSANSIHHYFFVISKTLWLKLFNSMSVFL